MLQQALKQLLQFLATPTGNWVILGVISFVVLAIVYHKKRQIPGVNDSGDSRRDVVYQPRRQPPTCYCCIAASDE